MHIINVVNTPFISIVVVVGCTYVFATQPEAKSGCKDEALIKTLEQKVYI